MINSQQQTYINNLSSITEIYGQPWALLPNFEKVREKVIEIQENFTQDDNIVLESTNNFNGLWTKTYFPASMHNKSVEILYIHGGGWTINSIKTHELLHRYYCSLSGLVLNSIEYPKSPEYMYPAAINLLLDYIIHISVNSNKKFVLIGDSAGANLAVALQLRLHSLGYYNLIPAIISNYGVFDHNVESKSYNSFGNDKNFLLSKDAMINFFKWYAGPVDLTNPYICPMYANLSIFPPVYISCGEYDVLLDENINFYYKLPVNSFNILKIEKSLVHGYMRLPHLVDQVKDIYKEQITWLHKIIK